MLAIFLLKPIVNLNKTTQKRENQEKRQTWGRITPVAGPALPRKRGPLRLRQLL